jgi:DNA-binding MarR family transcriptional regulator
MTVEPRPTTSLPPSATRPLDPTSPLTGQRAANHELARRLRLAVARLARRARQEAGAGDLGPGLAAALSTIERHGPLTPSELADAERVKRPTATRMLATLTGEGLVIRHPDASDGRSARIEVSAAGRELLKRMRRRKTAFFSDRLARLSADELATLAAAVDVLERLLEEER